jgi:hypothetical protein
VPEKHRAARGNSYVAAPVTAHARINTFELRTNVLDTAYWIAFGPHGPRAEAPPGENTKVFTYTLIGVGAGSIIFYLTHVSANPPPSTLTKEWQEKTNEYFKVRCRTNITIYFPNSHQVTALYNYRRTESSQSPVWEVPTTRAKVRSKVRRAEATKQHSLLG